MTSSQKAIKAALIDLSGTIHIEDEAIPGAQGALQKLRAAGVKVKFVTNTTKQPLREVFENLSNLKFDIQKKEIFTSLTAARCVVEETKVRPLLLLEECAKEDFEGVDTSNPNAVLVGLAPSVFDYEHLNEAFRLLLDGGSLIGIHKGRYYKKKDGLLHLGPGPFVSALEYATGVEAKVVGKPQATFFHQALQQVGVALEEAVMIGDDAKDDVDGSQKAGLCGILVQTGKYRSGDESKVDPGAWGVCKDFPAAVEKILEHNATCS
ncbi:hypothetical protein CAPTEDRAFT_182467 [Capitella teleta]|uniref:Haloacid dehalogenase-like hydrolase domain-containing protein 2 n=1 Tax=Capitella teleta TaxID=283909 RepID=R7TNJ6_CAPTE|nr:hypothetical protein CAPTEDRAFT_182467 [Capitella teleta]|eukprot:ELT92645.1 hypothetical protein CAPTEDRAFT_182467 [Capitella teleta]